jgi:hypothetical protein
VYVPSGDLDMIVAPFGKLGEELLDKAIPKGRRSQRQQFERSHVVLVKGRME